MNDIRWRCERPNNCTEKCEMSSPVEPTGCVYEDEDQIARDAKIWTLLDGNGNRSIFDDIDTFFVGGINEFISV